ncbi:ATP-binding protein [Thermodesulfobacteriota bacterium]
MRELVEETLNSLAHEIGTKEIEVSVGDLPDVLADRTAMEQIVGNLLVNAIKYLDPSRRGKVEISGSARDGEREFAVSDNGVGIAEADLEGIFQVFQRAGDQDVPGEGMGLAYVRTLARRHGGHIWCESEPAVGSTFRFTIATNPAGEDGRS